MLRQLIKSLAGNKIFKSDIEPVKVHILIHSAFLSLIFALVVLLIHISSFRPLLLILSDVIFIVLVLIVLWLIRKSRILRAVNLMLFSVCFTIFTQFIPRDIYITTALHHTRFLELEVLFIAGLIVVRLCALRTYHIVIYVVFAVLTIVADYFIVIYRFYDGKHTVLSIADLVGYCITFVLAGFLSVYAYRLGDYLFKKLNTEMRKVRHLNNTLQIKVRDRTKTLEQQNKELAKTNFELDSFVYKASHDLRAPLMSSLGLVNLIKEEQEKGINKEYLYMLETSLHKLDNLVKDILDLSQNARLDVEFSDTNVFVLITEVLEQYTFDKDFLNTNIQVEVPETLTIKTDTKRLKVILHNLISNAIRYSTKKQKGYITIKSYIEGNYLHLLIQDNGQGIAEEYQDKIFDMFYRATTSKAGSGLGLYIVKETIEKLKGKIKVHSKEGEGSTFVIILPRSKFI